MPIDKTFPVHRYWPALFVALHVVKVLIHTRGVDFSQPWPLLNFDYAQYYAWALKAHRYFQVTGHFWGYDPMTQAGCISGPLWGVGTHLIVLLTHAASSFVSIGRSLLWIEVGGLFAAPFALYAAVRNFGGDRNQAWSAFATVVVMYGSYDHFSATVLRTGLFGFQMAVFGALLQVSLVWRWFAQRNWFNFWAMTAASCLVLQLHAASLPVILIPNAVMFVLNFRRISARDFGLLALGIALVALTNLYWIRPFLAFRQWMDTAPFFQTRGFSDIIKKINPIQSEWTGLLSAILAVLLPFQVFRFVWRLRRRDRPFFFLWTSWILFLVFIRFFGSHVPILETLQPGRNFLALHVVVYALFGFLAPALYQSVGRQTTPALIIASLLVIGGSITSAARTPRSPLTNRFPAGQADLLQALKKETPNGRLLIECGVRGRPNVEELIPLLTGWPVVGGPQGNFLISRSSEFLGHDADSTLMGQPLRSFAPSEFQRYLDLYNVHRVAVWSRSSKAVLDQWAGTVRRQADLKDYVVYAVVNPSTWFIEGQGSVVVDVASLTVHNASAGKLVLKSHWLEGLHANPHVPLRPETIDGDPVPFIAIDNEAGHSSIVVHSP